MLFAPDLLKGKKALIQILCQSGLRAVSLKWTLHPNMAKKPSGYSNDQQFEPVQAFYYYKVHQRVLQAINYLVSRPDMDAKRLVIVGGSQGGRLGIVAAALDTRVAAVVSCIANLPNYPHLAWVARCNGLDKQGDKPTNPKFIGRPTTNGMELTGPPPAVADAEGRYFAYYNPMNYAPDNELLRSKLRSINRKSFGPIASN